VKSGVEWAVSERVSERAMVVVREL
jgi:hypothetical protein